MSFLYGNNVVTIPVMNLTLNKQQGTIQVFVSDNKGNPLAGVEVIVIVYEGNGQVEGGATFTGTTDTNGNLILSISGTDLVIYKFFTVGYTVGYVRNDFSVS